MLPCWVREVASFLDVVEMEAAGAAGTGVAETADCKGTIVVGLAAAMVKETCCQYTRSDPTHACVHDKRCVGTRESGSHTSESQGGGPS